MSGMNDFDAFDLTFVRQGLLRVHTADQCAGGDIPCCIHSPSDHHMRHWEMNWRPDTRVMERMCRHGIGHPDPDHMAFVTSIDAELEWQGIHGCDGCCSGRQEDVSTDIGGNGIH
jgi:hypothetical protein